MMTSATKASQADAQCLRRELAKLVRLAAPARAVPLLPRIHIEPADGALPDEPLPLDSARQRWGHEQHVTADGLRCWEYGDFAGRLGTAFALESESGALAWCVIEHPPAISEGELRAWLAPLITAAEAEGALCQSGPARIEFVGLPPPSGAAGH